MPQPTDHGRLAETLAGTYGALTGAITQLDDLDFYRPTRCDGLAVADLLTHVRLDAERPLAALATSADPPADRDAVSYWRDWRRPADGTAFRHARFLRVASSAYDRPSQGLVLHWRDMTDAAVRAGRAAPADGYVSTQGRHVLAVPDFVATLIVEAAVHHLDLQPALPDGSAPSEDALEVVMSTLDGLLGDTAVPFTGWDAATYALTGCGRIALTPADRDHLGALATRFPLLG